MISNFVESFLYNLIMEMNELIHKISKQLDDAKTQELFIDINKAENNNLLKMNEILKNDIHELQILIDDPNSANEFEEIFDIIVVTLEFVYLNTNLNLSKLSSNLNDISIKEQLMNMVTRKQMCSCD